MNINLHRFDRWRVEIVSSILPGIPLMRNWIKLLIFASMLPWPGYADEYGFDAGSDAFASENYATAVAIWRNRQRPATQRRNWRWDLSARRRHRSKDCRKIR